MKDFFSNSYYPPVEDNYFAGTIYENWNHFEEAEISFKEIIKQQSYDIGAYMKLWRLYENRGRYTEAEEIIKSYAVIDKEVMERELNTFYVRTIEKFPDNGDWNYKMGLLLYNRAAYSAITPYFDSIVYFPVWNMEMFIDDFIYSRLGTDPHYALSDKSATNSVDNIMLNLGAISEHPTSYTVPGTQEYMAMSGPVYLPRRDGINYLKRAAELLSEKETLGDIFYKIGNIYLWAGSKKQAYPHFEKSLALVPANANTRLKLVDTYTALFKNRAALQQLNYLHDSTEINFEKRLLLAKFNIHAGEFKKANDLLTRAEIIYPYLLPVIDNLRGLANMLAGKPGNAITFYKKSFNAQETDPWFNSYSLARLNAKTGNTKDAWKYLQTAVDHGFNYSFVLQNDIYMESLRKTDKWQTMISSIVMKKYKKDKVVN